MEFSFVALPGPDIDPRRLGPDIFIIANVAGSELDQCKLDLEELWCCQYAKERPVDDIISTSVSALSFNVSESLFKSQTDDKIMEGCHLRLTRLFTSSICAIVERGWNAKRWIILK